MTFVWSDTGATVSCAGIGDGDGALIAAGSAVPCVWSDTGATVAWIGTAGDCISYIDSGSADACSPVLRTFDVRGGAAPDGSDDGR